MYKSRSFSPPRQTNPDIFVRQSGSSIRSLVRRISYRPIAAAVTPAGSGGRNGMFLRPNTGKNRPGNREIGKSAGRTPGMYWKSSASLSAAHPGDKAVRQMLDAAHGVAECSICDCKRRHIARTECKSTHATFARNTRRSRQVPAALPDFRQGSRRSSAEARSRR